MCQKRALIACWLMVMISPKRQCALTCTGLVWNVAILIVRTRWYQCDILWYADAHSSSDIPMATLWCLMMPPFVSNDPEYALMWPNYILKAIPVTLQWYPRMSVGISVTQQWQLCGTPNDTPSDTQKTSKGQ